MFTEEVENRLTLAPEARGRGVGEALVRHCLQTAGECGFRLLQFNAVVATNTPARHLYEKLGFAQIGLRKNYYRNPKEDALILRKEWEI